MQTNILNLLKTKVMTQHKLGVLTGIHPTNISEYLKGKRKITQSVEYKFRSALDYWEDDLILNEDIDDFYDMGHIYEFLINRDKCLIIPFNQRANSITIQVCKGKVSINTINSKFGFYVTPTSGIIQIGKHRNLYCYPRMESILQFSFTRSNPSKLGISVDYIEEVELSNQYTKIPGSGKYVVVSPIGKNIKVSFTGNDTGFRLEEEHGLKTLFTREAWVKGDGYISYQWIN